MKTRQYLENLKDAMQRELSGSGSTRVGEELHNLFGQFHAKTLMWTALRVFAESAVVVLCLVMVERFLEQMLSPPACVLTALHGGFGERCSGHLILWGILSVQLLVLALASFVSTRCISSRRFQHSALLNVLVLFYVFFYAQSAAWEALMIMAFCAGVVLAMYTGYRVALMKRNRSRPRHSEERSDEETPS